MVMLASPIAEGSSYTAAIFGLAGSLIGGFIAAMPLGAADVSRPAERPRSGLALTRRPRPRSLVTRGERHQPPVLQGSRRAR